MADDQEKTEEPTSKKIDDAKKEGNVPKSAEVPGAAILFFASLYLMFLSSGLFGAIEKTMYYCFSFIGTPLENNNYTNISLTIAQEIIAAIFPLFLLIIFLAVIFNVMQFGFIVTPIKLKLDKIDPINGFKNVFTMKKVLEAAKLTAKLIVIFVVMVILLLIVWDDIIAMMNKSVGAAINSMIILTIYFILTILSIIILFAAIDFFFTRHYYFKQLKMSKQDIKDEYKQIEGDPLVKQRIRQIQRKMAQQTMMKDTAEADVVITNPTHYSVALKYDNKKTNAPLVVAKGIDFLALKIREIARENKIRIIEDPALARALYDQVEVSSEIPDEFYKAIADIFTYIYQLDNKTIK